MKQPFIRPSSWRASLWGLGIAASLTTPLAQAKDCVCGDLPAMIQELAEHEFMAKLFQSYSDYTPTSILTIGEMKKAAESQLNAAFYGSQAGAGTTSGAHAALGTNVYDSTCPILEYLYEKGQPVLNKDGTQKTRPVTEKTYKTKQCGGRTKADFAHEQIHVDTCKELVANGKTQLWDRLSFFAANDAKAYRKGAEVLREEIRPLATQCGWYASTQNRLPNVQEAHELAQRAAKARPPKRRKK